MTPKRTRTQSKLAAVALTAALACILATSACIDQSGMVLLSDPSWRASVIATSEDGFSTPDGILWRQGRLLMADEGGRAMRVWTDGHDIETLCDSTLGIQAPEDLVADDDGNLFFTDDEAGGVWRLDRAGRGSLLAGRSRGLFSTEGIVLSPKGDILVGDGVRHQVFRVNRSGKVSVFLDGRYGITKPESMVFDEEGNLYIADNEDHVVYLLTPQKELQRLIDDREGFSPETIWYADHTLYITDSRNGKLSRFTPEDGLETIAVFGGKLRNVCGVTTDEEGSIYVSIHADVQRGIGYIIKLEREPTS